MSGGVGRAFGRDRLAVVTGPTSGIGKEVARGLAAMAFEVVLACRNPQKGEAVRQEISRGTGNPRVSVELVDLASLASIRDFARRFDETHPRLDVLVNNAGVFLRHRHVTLDGLETQFAVNALAPIVLTRHLAESLRRAAPSRVVNVSSNAHYGGRIEFDNLQGERSYSGFRAYANSKLALVLLTYESARRFRESGILVNAVHPGIIRTNLGKGEYPRIVEVFRPFFKGPRRGAETPLYVANHPELIGVTGKYFAKMRAIPSDDKSYDEPTARRLWQTCARLSGLPP